MERSRHGSTAGQVRKAIRADIQTGVFPAGSRLTSEMLAERYRVSRTPVREALIRLEEDGLVCGTRMRVTNCASPPSRNSANYECWKRSEDSPSNEPSGPESAELLKELRQACELRRNSSVNGELEAGDFAFHRAICRPLRLRRASRHHRQHAAALHRFRRGAEAVPADAAGPTASTKRSCRPWRTATRSARGGC